MKFVETNVYTINFGWEYTDLTSNNLFGFKRRNEDSFQLNFPNDKYQEQIREFMDWLTVEQYEIKAAVPITTSLCSSQVSNNWGFGYGASQIVGYSFVCQRTIEVTEEGLKEKTRGARRRKVTKKLGVQKKIVESNAKNIPTKIVETKGLFKSVKYYVAEKQFESREEAETYLRPLLEKIENDKKLLEDLQAELEAIENE